MILMEELLMLETPSAAQKFLDSMTEINKQRLLNALLGLDSTHALNCNTSFYSYRNLKKIFKPNKAQPMQTLHFSNTTNDQLVIRQLKQHSFLKNSYRIEIRLNSVLYDYQLIDCLLQQLNESCCTDLFSYA